MSGRLATQFETTAQGCRLVTSAGGVLTGRGADIIVIDDPLIYSRLNDKLSVRSC